MREKLVISRERTADLHGAWKNQLFLLSFMIFVVTIHQLLTSVSSCIREIKDPDNDGDNASVPHVSGVEAVKLIFGDSFCELVQVLVSTFLAYFLALCKLNNEMELDNWPYMISSALVPVCLGFYFNSDHSGCAAGGGEESLDESAKDSRHQFPVVVIYHTIVTVAFWFMKSGMDRCEGHVKLVDDSIRDFERMDKKLALKKQLRNKTNKKK